MIAVALSIGFVLIAIALLLNLWRLAKGPDTPDRALALDTLYVNAVALMVLLAIHYGTSLFFEAALLIAMMGFIGTVAFAKYLLRGNIVE
jgi:multicomponent K+:H+ antiporter subunit F